MLQGCDLFKFLTEALHHQSHKHRKPHLLMHLGVWKGHSHQQAQVVTDKPCLTFGGEITGFPLFYSLPWAKPTPCLHQWRNFCLLNLCRDLTEKTQEGQHRFVPSPPALVSTNPQWPVLVMSILAGAALPWKAEVGSFGMSICHAPTDPTLSSTELPRQRCLAPRLLITQSAVN